jgi:hypothetical protein
MPSFGLPSARAEASRRNGAKSRGPKTPEGKGRSAQNALKHGLRAQKHVVLPDEDAAAFKALEAALIEELAPEGALQTVLAQRVVAATWRLERAERIEAEIFAHETQSPFGGRDRDLGLALIRDCNGARAFDTLLRYRGGTLAELWRALRTLKALQAEARASAGTEAPAPALTAQPVKPERRKNPCDSDRAKNPAERNAEPDPASAWLPSPLPAPDGPAPCATPIEPEHRRNPGEPAPQPAGEIAKYGSASLLAGTALVPACRRRA